MPRIDSLSISPITPHIQSGSVQAVPMPMVDFPDGAKILTWWPDTNYDYKMPNMLEPSSPVKGVRILDNNIGTPKGKDH